MSNTNDVLNAVLDWLKSKGYDHKWNPTGRTLDIGLVRISFIEIVSWNYPSTKLINLSFSDPELFNKLEYYATRVM